jgi:predicted dehydrogenase
MRVFQIGVARFGKNWRLPFETIPGLEVVGILDTNRGFLEEAQSHFGLPPERCFSDPYGDWPTHAEADFVVDSTPHPHHYENAIRTVRAGMDLVVVKPMSDDYRNAVAMADEAQAAGRKIVVAQQLRFFPPILALRSLVSEGRVGHPAYVSIDAFFGRTGPVREKWWQRQPLLMEAAIHHFDLVRWVTGLEATAVRADAWNMPWNDDAWGVKSAACLFELSNGGRFVFRGISTNQRSSAYPGSWVIEGPDGVLELSDGRITADGVQVWPNQGTEPPGLNLAELNLEVLRHAVSYFSSDEQGPEQAAGLTGAENLKSLSMAVGAVHSCESGSRTCLPLSL